MKLSFFIRVFVSLFVTLQATGVSGAEKNANQGCEVSIPNKSVNGNDGNYGNQYFSLHLPSDGVYRNRGIESHTFSDLGTVVGIRQKFSWYRYIDGELSITGERLDGDSPPLVSRVVGGYGSKGYLPTLIIFPTEGCWKVKGNISGKSVEFVILIKEPPQLEGTS